MTPVVCILVASDRVPQGSHVFTGGTVVTFDDLAYDVPAIPPVAPGVASGTLVVAHTADDPDEVWSWAVERFERDTIRVVLTAESPAGLMCRRCCRSAHREPGPSESDDPLALAPDAVSARWLVREQAAAHVTKWVRAAGAEAVRVVVVPPDRDSEVLSRRLASALDIYATPDAPTSAEAGTDREDGARADQREQLPSAPTPVDESDVLALVLALAGDGLDTPAVCACPLPAEQSTLWALSDELIDEITGSGAMVVGEPQELRDIPRCVDISEEGRVDVGLLAVILQFIRSSLAESASPETGADPEGFPAGPATTTEEPSSEHDRLMALVHHQQVEMAALSDLLEHVRHEYETSTSWRVTAPLRRVGSLRRARALRRMRR